MSTPGSTSSATARFAQGGVASGGISAGRERTDFCGVIGQAQIGSNTDTTAGKVFLDNVVGNNINLTGATAAVPSTLYCRVNPPYQPDWKGLVTYPLPFGFSASATWQNRAGPQKLASYVVSGTSQTTLGRAPTFNTASAHLIAPGDGYAERLNQLDVRLAKSLKFATKGRVQATVSVFNVLNANSTLVWNTTYGASWLAPSSILQGRLVKFGAQFDF